jgi:hypothetical protein
LVEDSIVYVADARTNIGWRDVWGVVRVSAERRLGRPLLRTYLVLAIAGAIGVAVSMLAMRL